MNIFIFDDLKQVINEHTTYILEQIEELECMCEKLEEWEDEHE